MLMTWLDFEGQKVKGQGRRVGEGIHVDTRASKSIVSGRRIIHEAGEAIASGPGHQ